MISLIAPGNVFLLSLENDVAKLFLCFGGNSCPGGEFEPVLVRNAIK